MTRHFTTDARIAMPAMCAGRRCGCACPPPGRRLFTGLLAASAVSVGGLLVPGLAPAQQPSNDGVRGDLGGNSRFSQLVSAEQVESAAEDEYRKMMREAAAKRALAPDEHPQLIRLRAIAARLIPFAAGWNDRARQWRWEINLIGSAELNAFCMPGGKIAFYYGLLQKLQLDDDEVAQIMGHEIAHALREHARERMGKTAATQLGAGLLSGLLGLGSSADALLGMGGQLLTLRFSREDESEADLVGLDLAARAGYNPRAGLSLWRKMNQASSGAPPQWLSTHPNSGTRMREIERALPKVEPLYTKAARPPRRFGPPSRT